MSEMYGAVLRALTSWQYELNRLISQTLKAVDSPEATVASLSVLGIALLYGIVHALGPGHGKALVGLYFLKQGGSYKKAFEMGYLIAVVHALSALALTLGIYYLIDAVFSKTFREFSAYAMLMSALLIIAVGLYLLYETLYAHESSDTPKGTGKSAFTVAVSAGIVPCPGVMTVTLFAIHMGHIALGVASALVMSVGMGLSISLAGVATIAIRKQSERFNVGFGRALQIASAFLVVALGVILLLAASAPPSRP